MQSVAVTVESPAARTTAPPEAEFEVIVQSVAVTIELPVAENAPPQLAEFEVIVQWPQTLLAGVA